MSDGPDAGDARHRHARRRLPGLRRRGGRRRSTRSDPTLRRRAAQHQGQHRERPAARGGRSSTWRWSRARSPTRRSPASGARRPTCASWPRCTPRPACSWCAPTRRPAPSPTCTGKPVAFGARGSGLVILARYVLDGLGLDRTATSRPSTSSAPATAPRWCWTAAWPRSGAAASAGPASPRWPVRPAARASSLPIADGDPPHPGQARRSSRR